MPVNAHCLIDSIEAAVATATDFSRDPPEPGDYFVVEVLRCDQGASA